jgi:hypothetical protein
VLPINPEFSKYPIQIARWDDSELWLKTDDKFKRPKGIVGFRIYTYDLEFGTTKLARVFAEVW